MPTASYTKIPAGLGVIVSEEVKSAVAIFQSDCTVTLVAPESSIVTEERDTTVFVDAETEGVDVSAETSGFVV